MHCIWHSRCLYKIYYPLGYRKIFAIYIILQRNITIPVFYFSLYYLLPLSTNSVWRVSFSTIYHRKKVIDIKHSFHSRKQKLIIGAISKLFFAFKFSFILKLFIKCMGQWSKISAPVSKL